MTDTDTTDRTCDSTSDHSVDAAPTTDGVICTDDQSVVPITPEAPTAPQTAPHTDTAMKLGDEFDAALIGATIQGQFAYSLTRLAMIVMQDLKVHPETAQQMVGQQVVSILREHGADAPVFVDDSLMFGADIGVEEEPQPIFTGEPAPPAAIFTGEPAPPAAIFTGEPTPPPHADNVILIPGVTHGGIRGFLDPDGIVQK